MHSTWLAGRGRRRAGRGRCLTSPSGHLGSWPTRHGQSVAILPIDRTALHAGVLLEGREAGSGCAFGQENEGRCRNAREESALVIRTRVGDSAGKFPIVASRPRGENAPVDSIYPDGGVRLDVPDAAHGNAARTPATLVAGSDSYGSLEHGSADGKSVRLRPERLQGLCSLCRQTEGHLAGQKPLVRPGCL